MITTTDAARGFQPAAALDGLADGIIVTGPEGPVIVYVNRAACDITGYEPGELIGRSPKLLQGPDTDPAVMRHLSADLAAGRTFNGQTVNYRKDGTPFVMEWSIATLLDDDDRPAFFVAVQRDATLPSRRLLAAEREARTDPLTGLPNRTHIDDILDGGGWLRTRAHSAIVIDVDHFKRLNDTHGHLVGDEVLRMVARRLAAVARAGDLVARWGGEEFCVLMLGERAGAAALAERVVEVVAAEPFQTSAGALTVTVSAGSAAIHDGCRTAIELLGAADRAMYAAKRGGRNRAHHA